MEQTRSQALNQPGSQPNIQTTSQPSNNDKEAMKTTTASTTNNQHNCVVCASFVNFAALRCQLGFAKTTIIGRGLWLRCQFRGRVSSLWVPLAGARQVLRVTTTFLAKPSWHPKAAHLAAHAKINGIIIAKVVMNEERKKSDQHIHCFDNFFFNSSMENGSTT